MSGFDATGWQSLGDALGGRGAAAQVQGAMLGRQMQYMGAMGANALSQVPLHNAQTLQALINARMAQQKSAYIGNVAGASSGELTDPNSGLLGQVIAAGLGPSYSAATQGRGNLLMQGYRSTLANPQNLSTPADTAASAAVTGKLPGPIAVPKEFAVPAGVAPPKVQETPEGQATITKTQAQANQAQSVADMNQPYSARQGSILAALTADGVSLPGGLRGQRQVRQTLQALDDSYPGYSPQQIADLVKSGKINIAMETTGAKAFATGKQGQQAQSFGAALAHLDVLQQLAGSLNNTASPLFNHLANLWTTQTGGPAPNNFNAAKQIVGAEIVKAIVGAGGGVGEREAAAQTVNAASSPAQLAGVIDTYKKLFSGQLAALAQTYQHSTGRTDFASMLAPNARAYYLQHVAAQPGAPSAPSASAPAAPTAPAAAAPPQITEGATAINRATGQRIIFRGGRWVPLQ